jgi:hypothetical protein
VSSFVQQDLFETSMLPGLSYRDALVSEAEEAELISAIEAANLEPFRFQGWLGKRETASFGWHYDFDGAVLGPAPSIPESPLRARRRHRVAP